MAIWNVEFSYNIEVEADTMDLAEQKAVDEYDRISPQIVATDEMNIMVRRIS